MDWRKLQKSIEVINSYYAFALLIYVAVLYVANHNQLFLWASLAATPLLTGWTGYLLHGFYQRRNQRYGFKVVSDTMSYEIIDSQRSQLRFTTKLKAEANHLIVYPIGYQWTGSGQESLPKLLTQGQQLLGVVKNSDKKEYPEIFPYEESVASEGKWEYWLVGLNPPAYKGDVVEIKYQQEFYDRKRTAKPYLYYFVRTPRRKLELNVKFPVDQLPNQVTCSYIKPSDPLRIYTGKGVQYDLDKQWATWIIEHPKKGYCYRIQWQ